MNYAIVLAGGKGKRMKSEIPKQFLEINGHPIIYYSIKAFQDTLAIDRIIVVTLPEYQDFFNKLAKDNKFDKLYAIAFAGKERYDSVYAGICAIPESDFINDNYCLIHDGARPVIDMSLINECLADAKKYRASVAAVPVKDTIKVADNNGFAIKTPDRRSLYQIQTPQTFELSLVYKSYKKMYDLNKTEGVTDDAMVVAEFGKVNPYLTKSSYRNIKVTTPEDLEILKRFLK